MGRGGCRFLLFFRVLGDHKAYFVYRFRIDRREREMSLGPYPELGLARRARKRGFASAGLYGIDRFAEKHGAKGVIAKAGYPTFGVMAIDHVETHEAGWRSPKHRQQWRQTSTQFCQPIWSMPVDQVTTADVLRC